MDRVVSSNMGNVGRMDLEGYQEYGFEHIGLRHLSCGDVVRPSDM